MSDYADEIAHRVIQGMTAVSHKSTLDYIAQAAREGYALGYAAAQAQNTD